MNGLKKTTDLVYDILVHHAATRDSDNELYIKVLEYYGTKLGVNFDRVTVASFFKYYRRYKIPSIETVGRCRRKVQEEHAELAASDLVTCERLERESDFREYARGGLHG
jgi:hypothetical protein